VPTQRDHHDRPPASDSAIRPWLLHGPSARAIVENVARLLGPAPGLLSEMNALRRKRELPPLDAADADALLRGALVHVRVTLCGRGAPDDMAFVYALEDQEARAWVKAHGARVGPAGYEVGEEPPDASEVSRDFIFICFHLSDITSRSYRKFSHLTVLSSASSQAATFRCPAAKGMPLARYLWSSFSRRGNRLTGKRAFMIPRPDCAADLIYCVFFRLGRANDWLVKVRNRDGTMCRAARIDYLE
jgi:hypothetical protein